MINCTYLHKVLENVFFLARQADPLQENWESTQDRGGAEVQSNFHQLYFLCSKDDPNIVDIMQRKARKYTDHRIQNELLQILVSSHLHKIAADINEAGCFSLESDEVTDASNKEQVTVCFRWVDA